MDRLEELQTACRDVGTETMRRVQTLITPGTPGQEELFRYALNRVIQQLQKHLDLSLLAPVNRDLWRREIGVDEQVAIASFVCPACGARSHNPNDIAQGYCGRCHAFTGNYSEMEVINVVGAQHRAIDSLMAALCTFDQSFPPSKSNPIWDAVVAGDALVKRLRGEP